MADLEIERAAGEARGLQRRLDALDPFWPAQLTVLVAILLYLTLPEKLTIGPTWLLPAFEGVLLVALVALAPRHGMRFSPGRRWLSLALVALVSGVNIVSLVLLVHYLLLGGKAGGHPLVVAGGVLWLTNVLLFAVWYWQLDRGGPVARALEPGEADFLFAQMTAPQHVRAGWEPSFVDYLYLSLTNSTAFSPTDTMPLTSQAKAIMGVQALASLVIVGLVVARAVNILS